MIALNTRGKTVAVCVLVLAAGCRSYTAKPLKAQEILDQVAETRRSAAGGEALALGRAAELMAEHNPVVRNARAAYAVERTFADVPTPMNNPRIDVVPTVISAGGATLSGVEGAFGWAIMLGGKRKLTDDVNAIRAESALVEAGAVEREQYLALRREFLQLTAAQRRLEARRELQETADRTLAVTRRMVEAAQAGALDVGQIELEVYGAEADVVSAEETATLARATLNARTGVAADGYRAGAFPSLPAEIPARSVLEELMLRDNPDFARLRAVYAVAEKELRLEFAMQYPDLTVGGIYETAGSDSTWGLGVGIDIPLFDRNQPGIARSEARRDEVRTQFESRANAGLAELDAALRRLVARQRRLEIMHVKVAPTADRTLELARRTLQAGEGDALRFLTVLSQQKRLRIEVVEAELELYEAWNDLEQACGAPLLVFPDEPDAPAKEEG